MKDLQIALIVFGVVLVLAVWLYNRIQEKRFLARKEREALASAAAKPKTMPPGGETASPQPARRIEPSLSTSPPGAGAPEPSFMEADLPLEPEAAVPAGEVDLLLDVEEEGIPSVPAEWSDGSVDCLVRIEFVAPVPVQVLREEHRDWSERIDKPVQWLGLDEHSGHWHTLLPDDPGSVKHLAAALQLVDRLGAVSAETLAAFVEGMKRLAQRFVGRIEAPDTGALFERAQELDAFCASVDLQLTLHVLPKRTPHLSGAALAPLIERAGLRREGERFVASNPDGSEVFALICRASTTFPADQVAANELTDLIFTLDVPRVAAGAQAFERLLDFARQCATSLGGQLADAHRKPLPEATIAIIRSRIVELQSRMAERGIVPGGVRALRLFA
ncbi:cell division protein ZipA C-terminal FtsZ-binding domain-containing protein [Sulfuricystis thermophila]|uniref:cell division protein ZipA C-terminal FtsZ-binding domain-containing protein n=1 Tax=Sulfuricystis thermophila TaxID=2496847 RepID=UPI001036CD77|nr:cell division protein ZipA C-terminal FtsZ-binding domain-containing protein [Sulfuricystis thermophila]